MAVRTTPLYDLSGPTFASAFQEGQTTQSSLETAEAQRQRALEQSIRAEKELAIRQAEEARKAQAAKRAAATSAEILRRLGAGAQGPATTAPTTPGVRTSTAQLPQTQIIPDRYFQDPGSVQEYAGSPPPAQPQPTVTPGIQRPGQVRAPGISVGPTPGTPSGAAPQPSGLAPAPVAPPGGGSYAGAPPGAAPTPAAPATETPRPATTFGSVATKYPEFNKAPGAMQSYITRTIRRVTEVASDDQPIAVVKRSKEQRKKDIDANLQAIYQGLNIAFVSQPRNWRNLEKKYNAAQLAEMKASSAQLSSARQWYFADSTRKIFEANPELFQLAARDPIAFYEQYKDVKPGEAPSAPIPRLPGVTISSTRPEAAARDSKAEFVPTPTTQGLKVGPSALETIQRTPVDKVAPVPLATLLNAERRKRDLRQFDNGINQLRQQAATLARNGKNTQAMAIMAKMYALASERARYANLVNLAEFEISGDANIIDQVARSGGAAIRIGPTNDPNTYAVFRTAPDGTLARAGTVTKDQLVRDYKMFYDQKYAERKQKEADALAEQALKFRDYRNRKELDLAHKQVAKEFNLTFRRDEGTGITVVYRGTNPIMGFRIVEAKDALGNQSFRTEMVPLSR